MTQHMRTKETLTQDQNYVKHVVGKHPGEAQLVTTALVPGAGDNKCTGWGLNCYYVTRMKIIPQLFIRNNSMYLFDLQSGGNSQVNLT